MSHTIIPSAAKSPVSKLFQIESILPRQPGILEYPKTEQRRREAALFTTRFPVFQLCLPCLFVSTHTPKGDYLHISESIKSSQILSCVFTSFVKRIDRYFGDACPERLYLDP